MTFLLRCFIIWMTITLLGCGFHFRNIEELPLPLHTIYLDCDNPYDSVAVGMKETLTALKVTLVSSPKQALYTLHLSKSVSSSTQPSISDITLATTISFTQSINASLINNATKKTLITQLFTETVVQTLNQNQITTNSTAVLGNQDLPRALASDLYIWLTTKQVTHALESKK